MSYLKFSTKDDCQVACDAVFGEMLTQAETVNGVGIVGDKKGSPNYEGTLTTAWDSPRERDGSFYMAAPEDALVRAIKEIGLVFEIVDTLPEGEVDEE